MQAWAKSPQAGPGWLVVATADAQGKVVFSPPAIPDLAAGVANGLRKRLPIQAAWWPRMNEQAVAVPATYAPSTGSWLRVDVEKFQIAPAPLRTVFAVVNVSLRDASNQPIWVERKAFSGVVHGGEKIDVDKLPGDLSQLRREIERASDWIVTEVVSTIH